jgi:hypothetical protein
MSDETNKQAHSDRHSTHHVHRGPESLPCYCAATGDHYIGHEVSVVRDEDGEVKRRVIFRVPASRPKETG